MQANIVIVGATRGFETLTYSIPPALDGLVQPGHRVLAPLRSRKVTGVVTEVGERLSTSELKPILEVLEPRPLFDRAASAADGISRVVLHGFDCRRVPQRDSRGRAGRIADGVQPRDAARRAGARHVHTSRARDYRYDRKARGHHEAQLEKVGPPSEVRATLARFIADGILERRDATTGRHREPRI